MPATFGCCGPYKGYGKSPPIWYGGEKCNTPIAKADWDAAIKKCTACPATR